MDPQPLPCWWIFERATVFNTRQVQLPTSPSFFDSFWRYQIWLEQDCSLTPIQNKQLETTIHWSLYNFPWSTCFLLWHTTQVPQEKNTHCWQSRTWCQSRNSAKLQAVLPIAAISLLRVSHGNRRKENGRIPVWLNRRFNHHAFSWH